VLIPGMV